MVEPQHHPNSPAGRILWGRVGVASAVVLIAFSFGRCGSDGVPADEVALLEDQIASLQSDNDRLQARVDSLNALLEGQADEPSQDPSVEPDAAGGSDGGSGGGGTHTVQTGDTLGSIALAVYGDSQMAQAIADANGLATDVTLQVGQVLQLPPG